MGVNRTAPWWTTWALIGSLVLLYLGERVLEVFGGWHTIVSVLGGLGLLAVTAVRALSWKGAEGDTRKVEGVLLLGTLGCLLAVLIWFVSSQAGMGLLGINFDTALAESRYQVTAQVIWITIVSASLLSLLGAQLAIGAHRHARGAVAGVESLRVTEAASAGLSVALLGAILFVAGYLVNGNDRVLDLSYFRTSVPGSSTEAMVESMFTPLTVRLFFPEPNEVKEEVARYFQRLKSETGNVQIEEYDRLVSRAIADEYLVGVDGTIVISVGDRSDRIIIPTEIGRAREMLRVFDIDVQGALLRLMQGNRTVYMTVGHGELNDPASAGAFYSREAEGGFRAGTAIQEEQNLPDWMRGDEPVTNAVIFEQVLALLNYDVHPLGIQNGLGGDIPVDAALVAILGPRTPFSPEELASLGRYLDRGGSLLLALTPYSSFELGPLAERLGVRFVKTPLATDTQGTFVNQRGTLSDRQILLTNQFYSHAATTSITAADQRLGIVMVGAGYYEKNEVPEGVVSDVLIEAFGGTFADLDGDFEFDEETERRFRYTLALAVQRDTTVALDPAAEPATVGEGDTEADGAPDAGAAFAAAAPGAHSNWRALLVSDAQLFSDAVLGSIPLNQTFLLDGARWLGRDEAFAGSTETESDIAIVQTRSEHVAWFYAIIFGAPVLVLVGGMAGVLWRRRRTGEV